MSTRSLLTLICWLPTLLLAKDSASGCIAGRVFNSLTGEPISRAVVRPSRTDQRARAHSFATSGEDGSFRVDSLSVGDYFVTARKKGFVNDPGPEQMTSATVNANECASGLLVPLAPLGSISGKVADENGSPMDGAHVYALWLVPTIVPARLAESDVHAVTDSAGHYSLRKLQPGSYYILATADKAGSDRVLAFSPAASSLDDATRVFLKPAENLRADIRFPLTPEHRITGTIADPPSGIRKQDLRLQISPAAQSNIAVLRRSVQIRPDWTFMAKHVSSGEYEIALFALSEGGRHLLRHLEIDVGSTDVTDVAITPMPRIDVALHVQSPNGETAPMGPAGFRLVPAGWGSSYGQRVDANGYAHIDGVDPNRYLLQVFPGLAGQYVASLQVNNREVLNQYVDFSELPSVHAYAVVRSGTGVIRGAVGHDGYKVILSPQAASPDGSDVHTEIVRENGSFQFANVPPGDYVLYASRDTNVQLWFQPAFLAALKDLATTVHLERNADVNVGTLKNLDRPTLRDRAAMAGFYFE